MTLEPFVVLKRMCFEGIGCTSPASRVWVSATPETTHEQIDGFFSQLPFKFYLPEVASVRYLPMGCLQGGVGFMVEGIGCREYGVRLGVRRSQFHERTVVCSVGTHRPLPLADRTLRKHCIDRNKRKI